MNASDLTLCKDCKKQLLPPFATNAIRTRIPRRCSACSHEAELVQHRCCEKAVEDTNCVCRIYLVCPDHGGRHVGTHD